MRVTVRYFGGCPHAAVAQERLRTALGQVGADDVEITLEPIETPEQAQAVAFRGSPTVLVDGEDPFLDTAAPIGLTCRIYETPEGRQGAPTVAQLRQALAP